LIDEMTAHAARESIPADGDAGMFGKSEFHRELGAANSDTRHCQRFRLRIVEADTPEIDRQAVFERPDDHLKDAAKILPLPDGPCDLIEQMKPSELRLEPGFGVPAQG